ncbi:MAG: metal-dependent phosphohydrolase [Actinomycetota bacterium]|nr:metal-dependent phosphohydrolase [Actinomycetota bacterium]
MQDLRGGLLVRYREPHRRYHDLRHLHEVLDAVELLQAEADDIDAVRWAAWFHDAVYDVRRTDNEERSAELAHRELAAYGTESATVREVARLVRLTATHDPASGDRNGSVLSDADLAILAAPTQRYAEYARDVRAEYAHLDDTAFATGRAQLLTALLQRVPLYRTERGRARWERRARANLNAELDRLHCMP